MELEAYQLKSLTVIAMVSGLVSAIASTIILIMIFRSQEKLTTTFHRIMFAMCLSDIVSSLAVASSSIPTPKEDGLWLASGTTETCEIQGFLRMYGGITTPLYNCGMVIMPMIVIRYNVSREVIRSRVEPVLLAFPFLWGTAFAVYFLMKDAFNLHTANCWVSDYPRNCHLLEEVECTRGEGVIESIPYIVIFLVAMLGVPTILVTCLVMIYVRIAKNERGEIPSTYGRVFLQRRAFSRILVYTFSWFITFVWYLISYILSVIGTDEPFALKVLHYIFYPLQGFMNFLVYIHPRYVVMRTLHPNQSCFKILKYALFKRAVIYNRESASPVPAAQVINGGLMVEKETSETTPGMQKFEQYEIFHRPVLEDERMDDLIN
jgi:hypothetical protein